MPLYPLFGAEPNTADILQTASARLAVDTTSTATTWATLLTLNMTTAGNTYILAYATMSYSGTPATTYSGFRLVIDSTPLNTSGNELWGVSETGCIFGKSALLSAGSHNVLIQWQTAAGGTMQCYPVSLGYEHASLVAMESLV